jgi:hypothetical protein
MLTERCGLCHYSPSFLPLQIDERFLATFFPPFFQFFDIFIYRLARNFKNVGDVCNG